MSDQETYIVARSFRINGWSYEAGEVFDWTRIAVNMRKVQMLLNTGTIKTLERALKRGLVKEAPPVKDEPPAKAEKRLGRPRK